MQSLYFINLTKKYHKQIIISILIIGIVYCIYTLIKQKNYEGFISPLNDDNIQTAADAWVSDSASAESIYGPIVDWDVSNVTRMDRLFYNTTSFIQDISNWNVSNVTTMKDMFSYTNFNQPIGNWNVSKVQNMETMFANAVTFNQPIGNWNVSNVTALTWMFSHAIVFNQNISTWNVGKNTKFTRMFNNAKNFNQDISNWNVGNVTINNINNMEKMFEGTPIIDKNNNQMNNNNIYNKWSRFFDTTMLSLLINAKLNPTPHVDLDNSTIKIAVDAWIVDETNASNEYGHISTWDVRGVTDMNALFFESITFNNDISEWDVNNVTTMVSMFHGAKTFNNDISSWNVSNVTTMEDMFRAATIFNNDISVWNVSNVTTMENMFKGAPLFNSNMSEWDVSKVTNMEGLFHETTNFNQDISNWDVGNVINMAGMFTDSGITINNNKTNNNNIYNKWIIYTNINTHSLTTVAGLETPVLTCSSYITENTCNTENTCYYINNTCVENNFPFINSLTALNELDIKCTLYHNTNQINTFYLECINKNVIKNIIIKSIIIDITCSVTDNSALDNNNNLYNNCNILLSEIIDTNHEFKLKQTANTFNTIGKLTNVPIITQEQVNLIKLNNNKITFIDSYNNNITSDVEMAFTYNEQTTLDTNILNTNLNNINKIRQNISYIISN